jgi:hypothetical protein
MLSLLCLFFFSMVVRWGRMKANRERSREAGSKRKALTRRGVPMTQGVYKVDKRYVKAKKVKRLTLLEKMRLKSEGLYKLRMSFVKKPRCRILRA